MTTALDPSRAHEDILRDFVLLLGEFVPADRRGEPTMDSPLLGAYPELDSMAIVELVAAIEERFGIAFDDMDLREETFASVGSVVALIHAKQRGGTRT